MRIGYARVSTVDQNLDLQLDALKKAECKRIYEEHASGKNLAHRTPELLEGFARRRCFGGVASRPAGRSLPELIGIAGELETRKVGLESITERIETVSPAGTDNEPERLCLQAATARFSAMLNLLYFAQPRKCIKRGVVMSQTTPRPTDGMGNVSELRHMP